MKEEDFKRVIEFKQRSTESLLSVYQKGTSEEKYTLAINYQDLARFKIIKIIM